MRFLEMDQSAKPGEKWRRSKWYKSYYITPAGGPGDGWLRHDANKGLIKHSFSNEELNASDWERC